MKVTSIAEQLLTAKNIICSFLGVKSLPIFLKIAFWVIITIFFFILWRRNKRISDEFEKNRKKIDEFGRAVNEVGRVVSLSNQQKIIEMFARTISDISKISGFGVIVSLVAAIISLVDAIISKR